MSANNKVREGLIYVGKGKQFVIILFSLSLILGLNMVFADSMKIKEIVDNNTKIRNQELIVDGEITSITYRETMGLYVVNLNDSSKNNDERKELETDIYLVSDETADVYILTTKHYDENQKVTFKTNILMNSKDTIGNDQGILYDKYISVKTGFTSPNYSKFMVDNLLKQVKMNKPWVLLIDIE